MPTSHIFYTLRGTAAAFRLSFLPRMRATNVQSGQDWLDRVEMALDAIVSGQLDSVEIDTAGSVLRSGPSGKLELVIPDIRTMRSGSNVCS